MDKDLWYNREMFGLSVRDITESEVQINMKIPASPDVLDRVFVLLLVCTAKLLGVFEDRIPH